MSKGKSAIEAAKRYKVRHKKLGLCIQCTEPRINKTHCKLHNRQHIEYVQRWRVRHPKADSELRRKKKARRLKLKQCVRCGNLRASSKSKIFCSSCLENKLQQARNRYQILKGEENDYKP